MKKTTVAYLALVHALLAVALIRPDSIAGRKVQLGLAVPGKAHIENMRRFHSRMDAGIPRGAAIFLGDSITQSMPVAAVTSAAVNYGIGSQTSEQLLESMTIYKSLARASVIYLNIGTNDIRDGKGEQLPQQFERILQAMPANVPLIWSSIVPRYAADNAVIHKVNNVAKTMCEKRPQCTYIDTWTFLADSNGKKIERHYVDAEHPGSSGYALWIAEMKKANYSPSSLVDSDTFLPSKQGSIIRRPA